MERKKLLITIKKEELDAPNKETKKLTINDIEEKVVPYLIEKKDYQYILIIHLLSDTFLTVKEILELTAFDLRLLVRWDKDSGINYGMDFPNDKKVFEGFTSQKINTKFKKLQKVCKLTEYETITTHTLRKIGAKHLLEILTKSGKTKEEALRILQKKLSHYSIESVIKYLGEDDPRNKNK